MYSPVQMPARRGFTLLELVCVIGIIVILASLSLGPASRVLQRVRADKWNEDASVHLRATVDRLQTYFQGKQDFPLVTLEHLEANQMLDPVQLRFLKDRRVTFIPFAGSDPDELVVIRVKLERGFLMGPGFLTETKGEITHPPE